MTSSPRSTRPRKRVLVIEDDQEVAAMLADALEKYSDTLETLLVTDAGTALQEFANARLNSAHFDAVILDLMLPYGSAAGRLDKELDPDELDTGIRLLQAVRKDEREGSHPPVLAFIITGRDRYASLEEARAAIGEHGKLYQKPFSLRVFKRDLTSALGISIRVGGFR